MGYWNGQRPPLLPRHGGPVPHRRPLLLLGDGPDLSQPPIPHRRHRPREHQHRRLGHLQRRRPQRHHLRPPQPVRDLLEGLLPRPPHLCPVRAGVPRQPGQGRSTSPSSSSTRPRATSPPSAWSTPTSTTPRRTGTSRVGEAYAALVINAVLEGPAWEKTALIWVYDEHGGWYDHVPPKRAVKPDNVPPELLAGRPARAPTTSPASGCRAAWSRPGRRRTTSPTRSSTTPRSSSWSRPSGTCPALTFRDANAHNMLDFFDFTAASPPFADPPALKAPKNPFSSPAALPPNSLAGPGPGAVPPHLHRSAARVAAAPSRHHRRHRRPAPTP